MKRILFFLCTVIFPLSLLAQYSVTDKSGKKPDWTMSMEKGFIVGIGNGTAVEDAKENAMVNVKAQITTAVADHISSTSVSKTTEITANKLNELYQSFSNVITTQSGKRDYLQGVSASNVVAFYWEKLTDKQTKAVKYQYFVKYPFSQFDLDDLVEDFRKKDALLTEEMNKALGLLDTYTTVEELIQCQSQLGKLEAIFIDERKSKCQVGIERCKALLASTYLADAGSELGKVRYSIKIGDKIVRCARIPVINSQCAKIQDRRLGIEVCEISYLFDECYDEPGNNVKVSYTLGNTRPEKMFYFDVAETKAELMISGNIRIMGGDVVGDKVTNAVCVIPIKSKFDSPCAVTNLKLEWKESGIVLDLPVSETLTGKGQHDLKVTIPNELPISKISNAVKPFKQLNGSIMYNSVKTGKASSIRIYRFDYTTGW
ncbi:MAG: hypothetical protein WCK18_03470 [Prolixibacteraceae bacterium]|jgi:hypothetical protein